MKGAKGPIVCKAFADGCGAKIFEPTGHAENVAIYGVLRGSGRYLKESSVCWYMDHGYFGKRSERLGSEYWRITKNKIIHSGDGDHSWDRFNKFDFKLKDWRKNGKFIIVIPPSPAFEKGLGMNNWLVSTLTTLKKNTDRPIVICKKTKYSNFSLSPDVYKISEIEQEFRNMKYTEAIKDAWVVVTFHSNAANLALIDGVPVIQNCEAHPIGTLENIESPILDREFLKNLAYNQWTLEEMRSGQAWEELNQWG